jgi:hypothetical protein
VTLFGIDNSLNRVWLMDPFTGTPFADYATGLTALRCLDFNPVRGSLYVSAMDNTIRELDPDTGVLRNSFAVEDDVFGIGFVGDRLFTSTGQAIQERDPLTGAVLSEIPALAGFTFGLAGGPAVPEPTALTLIGVGALGLLGHRRRRGSSTR